MIAAAKNKHIPTFHEYPTHDQLASMYNALATMPYKDYRIVYTNLHLVLEVTLKKLALYHNLHISVTSHSVGSYLFDLREYEPFIQDIWDDLISKGVLKVLQRFPYDGLRFKASTPAPEIPMDLFFFITKRALSRLYFVEKSIRRR